MGYFLLYESMLSTVLVARDRWLKPTGILAPDHAVMFIEGVDTTGTRHDNADFWSNVYGFDFSSILPQPVIRRRVGEAIVDTLDAGCTVTNSAVLKVAEPFYTVSQFVRQPITNVGLFLCRSLIS